MPESVVYTPFDLSDAVKTGRRRFWKQVLPVTKINYKGQEVNFDPKYHMDLADAFRKEAFDQVPVVFADSENRHNMDPRNFGGDVLDMQYRGPGKEGGTWALIEADKEAAKAISKNPRLGVSARIRQGLEKSDGRTFDRAIEHICLTMNPRVTGMAPWQAVDLSDEDTDIEVVDLTAANYEEGSTMGVRTAKKSASSKAKGPIDLSALSDEQFQSLLDLAETLTADPEEEVDEEDEDLEDEEVDEVEPPRRTKRKKSKTKVTIEKDSESDDDEDEEEDEEDDDTSDLSDSDNVIRRGEVSQFQQMRLDLAESRWQTQRGEYLDAGVPAFLLDLAEPVMSLPDAMTIDLSDDETLDATDTIRQMLDGVKGIVDLTGELGHQIDLSGADEEDDDTSKFLKAWDEQYG